MLAFHNDPQLKIDLIRELKWHIEQDMVIQGLYGTGLPMDDSHPYKGCTLGCSIRSLARVKGINTYVDYADRAWYAREVNLPVGLVNLEEEVFENLDKKKDDWRTFPLRFVEAIPVGKDLSGFHKVLANHFGLETDFHSMFTGEFISKEYTYGMFADDLLRLLSA